LSERLFIAIELSIAVAEQLMELQEEFDDALSEPGMVRWVHPENIHLTLKYLGQVDSALIELLEERLRALVSPLFPFQTECKRIEGSPGSEDASILWACLDKQSGEVLGLLRRALEQELEKIGIPYDERPFKPRLMLGRARNGKEAALLETLSQFEERGFGASTIKDLVLFAVDQDVEGVNYRVINRFLLGEN
jgi:2'-5' RNA ligase